MCRDILGGKLIISNHPNGNIENHLGFKFNKSASKHYLFNWGEEDIAKAINTDKKHQIYCELMCGIVFRVNGEIGTCCSDWNNENDFLNEKFPHCEICNNKNVLLGATKSGRLKEKISLLQELKKRVDDKI